MTARRTIPIPHAALRSLAWWGDDLVDWLGGVRVDPAGQVQRFGVGSTYRMDAAVGHGGLGVIYELIGTKGRLGRWNGALPEGGWTPLGIDVVRELDRSYYHADAYSFPVALFTLPDGRDVIAHCPRAYRRLDLETIDGTLLTPRDERGRDCFHSRLEASPDGRWLLCNGWAWAPVSIAHVHEVARALAEPAYLSSPGVDIGDSETMYEGDGICGATFAHGGDRVIATCETHLGVFALPTGDTIAVHAIERPGTRLVAWGPDHVVCVDGTPRVVELATGAIVERWDDLDGGPGLHQPHASMTRPGPPWLAADPARARLALGWPDRIVVVSAGT
jgi:hypothetical protein